MNFLMVAGGGALGAMARYGVASAMPFKQGGLPWATLAVNIAGTVILAVLGGLVLSGRLEDHNVRLFVGTGFCGALTTFSTFAFEAVDLARGGHVGLATLYVGLNLLVCLLAAWALLAWVAPPVTGGV